MILLILFFLSRSRKKFIKNLSVYLYFILVVITLNGMWVFKGGSQSPTPIVFIVLMAVIVYLNPKPGAKIISFIMGANILALLFIEWQLPHLILPYKNEQQRIFDHAVVVIYLFAAVIPALSYARKIIIREKEKAEHDNRQKSAYLANMSHEIRTPMNAIVGFAELLQQRELNFKERDEYIYIIRQNSELLLNLINNILDLSKLEANLVSTQSATVCINSLMMQVYNAHINQAKKAGIHLEKDIPPDLQNVVIESDRTLLFQVFSNFITNALKVTLDGDVRFGARIKKDRLSFFVFDTGPGIPLNQQKKIFKRFSQLKSQKSSQVNSEGVGLGLSICKAIVDLLGGEIELHSEVNKGSTFIFSFPAHIIKFHNHHSLDRKTQEIINAEMSYQ
jgi:signal transduction histidine kinase